MEQEQKCACGQPLHYSSEESQAMVQKLIDRKGECVDVVVGSVRYKVPRHYIALHGIKAEELPGLASQLGFEEVLM